jgi:hypothetical protein
MLGKRSPVVGTKPFACWRPVGWGIRSFALKTNGAVVEHAVGGSQSGGGRIALIQIVPQMPEVNDADSHRAQLAHDKGK